MNNWTIIFLVSAENDLIAESVKAIEEIYQARHCDSVKFLVIFDGVEFGKFSADFAKPSLYEVSNDNGFFIDKPVYTHTSDNLADKRTLIDILNYAKTNYKAENYGFFYKGHGGSGEGDIVSGFFVEKLFTIPPDVEVDSDEKMKAFLKGKIAKQLEYETNYKYGGFSRSTAFENMVMVILKRKLKEGEEIKSLTYKAIADCIKTVFEKKIGFVCLDCCWGQQIENAFTFGEVAENFIASVDESPALGIGYSELCKKIVDRPHIVPEEIANMIVAVYYFRNYDDYDSPIEQFNQMGVSMTNVSTRSLFKSAQNTGNSFEEIMKAFCDYMIANMTKLHSIVMQARKKCKDYTYANTEELEPEEIHYAVFNIDLPWFLTNLKFYNKEKDAHLDKLITALLVKIQYDLIVGFLGSNYKKTILGGSDSYTGGNGLGILFPISKAQADAYDTLLTQTDVVFYEKTHWDKFLYCYYNTLKTLKTDETKSLWGSFNTESFSFPLFKEEEERNNKDAGTLEDFTYNKYRLEITDEALQNEAGSNWSKIVWD